MIQWDLIAERRPRNFRRHLAANLIWRQAKFEQFRRTSKEFSKRRKHFSFLIRFLSPPSLVPTISIQLPSIRSFLLPSPARLHSN